MDLREWLKQVEAEGELRRVPGASWNLEMGAIVEVAYRKAPGNKPAFLFENIPDYPEDYRVVIGLLGSPRRLGLTLGIDGSGAAIGMVRDFRKKLAKVELIPAVEVKESPILENVHRGKEIDLLEFPAPWHHELDGGRYLGTAHSVITRDPDNGQVNLGTYRLMVHDRNRLGLHILPGQHGAIHRDKHFARNEPFPVAVAIGTDPLLYQVSCTSIPRGISEYEYAGGLQGRAVPVLKGEVTGLPLPAEAEIVLEGICHPGETKLEGPFGEWCGYYANNGLDPVLEPVIIVEKVMHRRGPILTAANPGIHDDPNFHRVVARSALIWDDMEKAGVPDVQGVWCHEAGKSRFLTIVSIKQRYAGHARQAGAIACQCHAGAFTGRYVIVVDEDIDPSNTFEVLWALSTRSDPAQDIEILRRCWSSSADPMIPSSIAAEKKGLNSRAIIDACRPFEWKDDFPPSVQSSPELEAHVRKKFASAFAGILD